MQLVFVYSVGSTTFDNVKGAVQKAIGGGSLCALCNITYGVVNEKEDWSAFVETLDTSPVYYHTDDMPADLKVWIEAEKVELPVVLEKTADAYRVIVPKSKLEACNSEPACLIKELKPFV